MRALVLTPEAFDDLRTARRWYEEQHAGLGAAFELAIEATLTRIQRMPTGFPEVAPPLRRAIIRRYPYDVYYEFNDREIVVVLVFHTAQNPARLLQRLRKN
jgi:plasmid stabilization system protein ParE